MGNDIQKILTDYLKDAHAIEVQALEQLEKAPDVAGEPAFAEALRNHLDETEGHERKIRALIEGRGEHRSRIKDAALGIGGKGFLLFARVQTDTPGKLASHAFSFEALEWATYDLLARAAELAGEPEVSAVARSIREEERRMMTRIEALFGRTADASLEKTKKDDLQEHLRRYLADAHALEEQSIELLESSLEEVEGTPLEPVFHEHLAESRVQEDRIQQRLDAAGGDPSTVKDAALRTAGFTWKKFFGLQPDTTGKLAAFAYALEHLEIGGYEQLRHVAERAGDAATVDVVDRILGEERRAAEKLSAVFGSAVAVAVAT